ncbi:GAF domain-containing protein [Oxalobacteraceae bacterium OM1]|nr:GAF domain-containing protein [Oxalobacteraceae bacterium OM1]
MDRRTTHLHDIVITQELILRTGRQANADAERLGSLEISKQASFGRQAILQAFCNLALTLCEAGSSGVSLLQADADGEYFSWEYLAGRFAPYTGGRAPRHHSPCGHCLERGSAQLYSHPDKFFEWLAEPNIPVVEGLVLPLYKQNGIPYGTIWIMSHDEARTFDREDLRIMSVLGSHMSAALRLHAA